MNPGDDENAPVFLDFSDGFGFQIPVTRIDATRLQRASKGPGQSTARSGHYVVKCGGIGWVLIGRDSVMLGYLRVHAECHRLFMCGEPGASHRTPVTLDSHFRCVNGQGFSSANLSPPVEFPTP